MNTKKFIKTSDVVNVENYPYGFKLRTTLFDSMDFNKSKGYRHVTQTIDPRSNKLNKPKKSTYYALLVRYYNQDNHIKSIGFDFNGDEEINKGAEFIYHNFELFTTEEIKYLYEFIYRMSLIDFKATIIYGGSNADVLRPFYADFWEVAKKGINNPDLNLFNLLKLDTEAINKTKPENYNPFVVRTHQIG